MDIKAKIEEIVEKIKNDKQIMAKFQKDPAAVIEELIGVDLPNDQVNDVVDAIKAKLTVDKLGGALGGLFGKKLSIPEANRPPDFFCHKMCATKDTNVFLEKTWKRLVFVMNSQFFDEKMKSD